jgi:hypothetical protein
VSEKHQVTISEKTVVPIGWVFALLAGGAGSLTTAVAVTFYFSAIEAKSNQALASSYATKEKQEMLVDVLHKIDLRLANIEGALGVKRKRASALDF